MEDPQQKPPEPEHKTFEQIHPTLKTPSLESSSLPTPPTAPLSHGVLPSAPPNNSSSGAQHLFQKDQLYALYATLGLLGVSVVPGLISKLFFVPNIADTPLGALIWIWFLGVLVGAVLVTGSFLRGLFRIPKDHGHMVLSSVVLFLILLLVGGGTCAINVFSLSAR